MKKRVQANSWALSRTMLMFAMMDDNEGKLSCHSNLPLCTTALHFCPMVTIRWQKHVHTWPGGHTMFSLMETAGVAQQWHTLQQATHDSDLDQKSHFQLWVHFPHLINYKKSSVKPQNQSFNHICVITVTCILILPPWLKLSSASNK